MRNEVCSCKKTTFHLAPFWFFPYFLKKSQKMPIFGHFWPIFGTFFHLKFPHFDKNGPPRPDFWPKTWLYDIFCVPLGCYYAKNVFKSPNSWYNKYFFSQKLEFHRFLRDMSGPGPTVPGQLGQKSIFWIANLTGAGEIPENRFAGYFTNFFGFGDHPRSKFMQFHGLTEEILRSRWKTEDFLR